MWLLPLVAAGSEPVGSVTLAVAVPRDAGDVHQIAVDGAAGQCTVVDQALQCPATGDVTFRWGPGGDRVLVGDTVLAPGGSGTAVVWADEASRAADRERLQPDRVTAQDVRDLFIRTGDHPISLPSAGMFADLLELVDHPDPLVRRQVVDALVPYWRHTSSDPFPLGAPPVVPSGLLTKIAADRDPVVRRRLASRLRDLREPGEPIATEATVVLFSLVSTAGGAERAAIASLTSRARDGSVPAQETWSMAMQRVSSPGATGRAAANTLAVLAGELEPGPDVDPSRAVALTARQHPERAWKVWRAWSASVPFEPVLASRLLRETIGLSPALIRAWAKDDPTGLSAVLHAWEPNPPHSERYQAVVRAFEPRPAADDNLSPDAGSPGPQ
jgi:hypothetical protein